MFLLLRNFVRASKYFLCHDNVWFKFVVVRTPLWIISLFPFCKIHMHVKSENPWGVYTTFYFTVEKNVLGNISSAMIRD